MDSAKKLSGIVLAAALGSPLSAAVASSDTVTNTPTSQDASASVTNNASNFSTQASAAAAADAQANAFVTGSNSVTTWNTPLPSPKIVKESYKLGACSGSAYQALWQVVKMGAIFNKNGVDGLISTIANSFTIRQYRVESEAERASSSEFIAEKMRPKPVAQPLNPNTTSTTNTSTYVDSVTGGNSSVSGSTPTNSVVVPQYYKHITYSCNLGR